MEEQFVVLDIKDPTPREEQNLQLNDQALDEIYEVIYPKVFESIKYLVFSYQVWNRHEDTYEGTPMVN